MKTAYFIVVVQIAVMLVFARDARSKETDIDKLPNGRKVPCRVSCTGCCVAGTADCLSATENACLASGHTTNSGVHRCDGSISNTNPFGDHFYNNGAAWNTGICQTDSDGDGKTNGDELGDPCCVWSVGQTPRRSLMSHLSHPAEPNDTTSLPSCSSQPAAIAPVPTFGTTTSSTMVIEWGPSDDTKVCACGFGVEIRPSTGGTWTSIYSAPQEFDGRTATASGLSASIEYEVRVVVHNFAGFAAGNSSTHTTEAPSLPGPPGTPIQKSATDTHIEVEWSAPTNTGGSAIIAYHVDIRMDGVWNNSVCDTCLSLQWSAFGLNASTLYGFRVRAENVAGIGAFSEIGIISTNAPDASVPSKPTPVIGVSANFDRVTLSWTEPSLNGGSLIGYSLLAIIGPNTTEEYNGVMTQVEVENLPQNTEILWKVACRNGVGLSEYSDPVVYGTTAKPVCLDPDCSHHGICNTVTGECACEKGFSGDSCEITALSDSIVSEDYPFTEDVGMLEIFWKVESDTVEFALRGAVAGYLSLGFLGEDGILANADIVVGWVKDGQIHCIDYHTHDNSDIYGDTEQSIVAFNGREVGGVTEIKFIKTIATTNEEDQPIREGGMELIWAVHESDPTVEWSIPQHSGTNRGRFTVNLFTGSKERDLSLLTVHAWIMMISWVVCIVPSHILERSLRGIWKKAQKASLFLLGCGTVMIIAATFVGVWYVEGFAPHASSLHGAIGLSVGVAALLVLCLRVYVAYRDAVNGFPVSKGSAPTSNKVYWIASRGVLLLALANPILGLLQSGWSTTYLQVYVVVIVVVGILREIVILKHVPREKEEGNAVEMGIIPTEQVLTEAHI